MKKNQLLNKICASIATLMLLFILLVTSAKFVCFGIPGWFRYEYNKQNVTAYVNGEISLDDCVYVSDQVLYYCIGERNTIADVKATIDGKEVNFFTSRELIHLEDCRTLIMGVLAARLWAVGIFIVCATVLYLRKAERKTVARMYFVTTAIVVIVAAIMVIGAAFNFDAFFIKFHEVFFNNDYWLLDPYKDNLVNIMREGVFSDTAALIAGIWAACVAVLSLVVRRRS